MSGEDGTFTIGAPQGWKTHILEGAITGSGTLTLKGGTNTNYAFGWALNNDMSGFSGKIKLENLATGINQLKLRGSNGTSFSNIEVDLTKIGNTQKNILLVEATATIKGVSGTSTDAYVLSNGAQTLTLNTAGSDFSFAGSVGSGSQFYADNSGNGGTNAGTLSLVKSGTGTQTLSGTSYFGDVAVSGGELIFSGTSATSKGTASVAGTLTTSGSGVVKVLENGVLDLSGATVSLANAIQNSGQVTLSTGTLFEVSTFGQTVSLISGAGTISGVEWNALTNKNFTYNGAALGRSTVNVSSAGSVNISSYVEAKTLTWNGSASDTWSEAVVGTEPSSKPWKDESDADDAFYAGDSVVFRKDETTTVTVADSGVNANTVTISAGTVSFTGGTITATGGVSVTGGTLAVASAAPFGTNVISLSGGTLQAGAANLSLANAVNVAADSEVNTQTHAMALSGVITGTGTLTKQGTGTLVLTNNGNAFAGAIVSEGTLVVGAANGAIGVIKAGADARIFASPETAGSIVVESGAAFKTHLGGGTTIGNGAGVGTDLKTFNGNFYLKSGSTLGNIDGHVKLAGNIVFGATDTTGAYSTDATVTLTQHWQKTVELAGVLSGAGTVTLTTPTSDEANAFYKISGDENTFSGTYKLENATNKTSTLVLSSQNAAKDAKVNLSTSGARIFLGAANVTIAGLEGVSGSTIQLTTESGAPLASTLTVNQATNTTFAGTIADGIALKKAGAGTLTLSGDNSAYAGTVTLEAGTLGVGHANALGTSTVNVTGDAKLALGDTIDNWSLGITNNISIADSVKLTLGGGYVVALNGAITGSGTLRVDMPGHVALGGDNSGFSGAVEVVGTTVDAAHASALGTGILKISSADPLVGTERTSGTVQASAANVALHDVSIELVRTDSSILDRKTPSGSFTVAAGATLYLDIGLLTEATLTGEQVALTIAAASAFDNSFFSAVEVGTYVDDAWKISSEWKYLAGSWDVGAGTLKISAIPEPSLFGLLAGLGALALAGTRRRRKKA
ncbi:MAG: beta strand repeat-containing protein [Candidatus Spyradosoma sp.]